MLKKIPTLHSFTLKFTLFSSCKYTQQMGVSVIRPPAQDPQIRPKAPGPPHFKLAEPPPT